MPIVHFLGKVMPSAAEISVGHDPTVKWESPDNDLTVEIKASIQKSAIDVQCTVNRFTPADLMPVYMRAIDICRASVELVAFSQGIGLSVVLDTIVKEDGTSSQMVPIDPSVAALCTAFKLDSSFDQIHLMVLSDWRLAMALNDLILAITIPHVSAVNCARAVEGLRHLIAPGLKDKQAWEKMRKALQLDRAYIQLITDTSTSSRHGDRVHVPGSVTTDVTRRSWTIMNRYFEYRKRGEQDLLPPEFPMLIG